MMNSYKRIDFENFTNIVKKTLFFITAFLPLWCILIINYSLTDEPNFYCIFASIIFLSLSVTWLFCYLRKKENTTQDISYFKVLKKYDIGRDVVFYILAYIPALLIDEFEFTKLPAFAVILLTIYVLYIKTNMLHINPLISLKYNTYKVIDDHENTVIIFSSLKIKTGREIPYQEISSDVNIATN